MAQIGFERQVGPLAGEERDGTSHDWFPQTGYRQRSERAKKLTGGAGRCQWDLSLFIDRVCATSRIRPMSRACSKRILRVFFLLRVPCFKRGEHSARYGQIQNARPSPPAPLPGRERGAMRGTTLARVRLSVAGRSRSVTPGKTFKLTLPLTDSSNRTRAGVAELADAQDLGSCTERCRGSTPLSCIAPISRREAVTDLPRPAPRRQCIVCLSRLRTRCANQPDFSCRRTCNRSAGDDACTDEVHSSGRLLH